MSRKKRSRKPLGHYCWACNRSRPNEKFSGGGHARHLCRDCSKLGTHELAYRQALNDLERCITWEGINPRRRRKTFEQFLSHDDPRIRTLAEEMRDEDLAARRALQNDFEVEEAALDPDLHTAGSGEQVEDLDGETGGADDHHWISQMPF